MKQKANPSEKSQKDSLIHKESTTSTKSILKKEQKEKIVKIKKKNRDTNSQEKGFPGSGSQKRSHFFMCNSEGYLEVGKENNLVKRVCN